MSEALILNSPDPKYDKRLFTDLQVQYMKITSSVHVVYTNWTGNSMDNLLSYCGLVDARLRTSEKDLPVHEKLSNRVDKDFENNKWASLFIRYVRISLFIGILHVYFFLLPNSY